MKGGAGGIGQGPRFGSRLTPTDGTDLPPLPLTEFCRKYNLSEEISKLLHDLGFKTTRALFSLSNTDLQQAGFKLGQIAELKVALSDFALQKD